MRFEAAKTAPGSETRSLIVLFALSPLPPAKALSSFRAATDLLRGLKPKVFSGNAPNGIPHQGAIGHGSQ